MKGKVKQFGQALSLPKNEWNFDLVPDAELLPCLYWEYSRECESFAIAEIISELEPKTHKKSWDSKAQKWIRHTAQERRLAQGEIDFYESTGFNLENFLKDYYECDLAYDEWYDECRRYAHPYSITWQDFDKESREYGIKRARSSYTLKPIQNAFLYELEYLWNARSGYLKELRVRTNVAENDDSEDAALYEVVEPIRGDVDGVNSVFAFFNIDFARYSNKEIVREFSKWVLANRPSDLKEQTRRGKKTNDLRVALEALGIMRILHWYRWRDPEFPLQLKKRGETACYKARKVALKRFQLLFPYLPKDERPISWDTAGGRKIS